MRSWALPAVFGGLAAALLWLLLQRLLFAGQAQSYDAALYARSLWGLAHGDLHNPVVDRPSLQIHAQHVLWLLAPFARVARSLDVLIAAQSCTFGATCAAFLHALLRAHDPAAGALQRVALAAWGSFLFAFASPLVANPFLFDVRPELLGVLPLTLGLLRAVTLARVDGPAAALMLLAALAREELALVAACALLLSPVAPRGPGLSLRARSLAAAPCIGYFVVEHFLSSASRSASEALHVHAALEPHAAPHKAALALSLLAGGGGLCALGYRWLGSTLPAVALLGVSAWRPQFQLSFHYGLFAAPGLLAATYSGYLRLAQSPALRRLLLVPHAALALLTFAVASAWPGGALFAREHFDVHGPVTSIASFRAHTAWLLDAHATLATIPASHSLLLPYPFAAPLADRARLRVLEVPAGPRRHLEALPRDVDTVALLRGDWLTHGRRLRRERGLQLWALSRTNLAVLSRKPRPRPLRAFLPRARCDAHEVSWPSAGLALCNAWRGADGRANVVVERISAAGVPPEQLELRLRVGPAGSAVFVPLHLLDGLLQLSELPPHIPSVARTVSGLAVAAVRLSLSDARGQPIPLLARGSAREDVPLTLATDLARP